VQGYAGTSSQGKASAGHMRAKANLTPTTKPPPPAAMTVLRSANAPGVARERCIIEGLGSREPPCIEPVSEPWRCLGLRARQLHGRRQPPGRGPGEWCAPAHTLPACLSPEHATMREEGSWR
jgi:hypothetical protein